jgi:hypothetical protein
MMARHVAAHQNRVAWPHVIATVSIAPTPAAPSMPGHAIIFPIRLNSLGALAPWRFIRLASNSTVLDERCVQIGTTIAENAPGRADLRQFVEVEFRNRDAFLIPRKACDDRAGSVRNE